MEIQKLDDMCECGHDYSTHEGVSDCFFSYNCGCKKFVLMRSRDLQSIVIKGTTYHKRSYGRAWYYVDSWGVEHGVVPYMIDAIEVLLNLSYGEKL